MLPNTIILPEDTAGAIQNLNALLVEPAAAIYLFIFGDSETIQAFAADADVVAGGALRRVVRRSTASGLMARFTALPKDPDAGDLASPHMIGFATSGHLVIADVILSTEALTDMRASDAFILAEGQA